MGTLRHCRCFLVPMARRLGGYCIYPWRTYVLYLPNIQTSVSPHAPYASVILQLRLYALYSLNKKILILMGTVFVGTVISSAGIMGAALQQIKSKHPCSPLVHPNGEQTDALFTILPSYTPLLCTPGATQRQPSLFLVSRSVLPSIFQR